MKTCIRIRTFCYQVRLLEEVSNQAIQCGKCETAKVEKTKKQVSFRRKYTGDGTNLQGGTIR